MAIGSSLSKKNKLFNKVRSLMVWTLLFYLRFWAKIALFFFNGKSIGIAGAVGKSTARNALSAILSPERSTHVVSNNSETGIPLGILSLSIGTYSALDWIRVCVLAPFKLFSLKNKQLLIVEMGIDGPKPPKNMAYLLTIIKPDIGILLNESPAHVQQYEALVTPGPVAERLEHIIKMMTTDDGRMVLQSHCTMAIVTADDPYIKQISASISKDKLRTVGTDSSCDVTLRYHAVDNEGTHFEFSLHSFQIKDDLSLFFPHMVLPKEVGYAIGSAIVAALAVDIPIEAIKTNLERFFTSPPGRGTIFSGMNESTIFDSSYNASSASVLSFTHLLKEINVKTRRPIVFLLGDMVDLGSFSQYEHEKVARELPHAVNHLLLVGPLTKQFILPYAEKHRNTFKSVMHFSSTLEAGSYLKDHLPEKAIVAVKGSQQLEEAIKYILQNKEDAKKLCRQDLFWQKTKKLRHQWANE